MGKIVTIEDLKKENKELRDKLEHSRNIYSRLEKMYDTVLADLAEIQGKYIETLEQKLYDE